MANSYDVVVIGAGPGGYVAAIRAGHHGLKVALVEKDVALGGTCLLRGCIPTKSLLHAADVVSSLQKAQKSGLVSGAVGVDFSAAQKEREKVIKVSAQGVAYLMKQNKIDVVHGTARILSPTQVTVSQGATGSTTLQTKFIICATGSVPRTLPFLPQDSERVITSDEALGLAQVPQSLLILGAGAVGVEFASIYQRFGASTTLVEMMDRILPVEDDEISVEYKKLLEKRGITVHVRTQLTQVDLETDGVAATLETPGGAKSIKAEKLLVAVGRRPVTENLGLDAVGLKVDSAGFIDVDRVMRTHVPNIYAIGDIVKSPQLAHVASSEALLAVDHLAGKDVRPLNYDHVPSCTYSDPEVASVGLSERTAKERGIAAKVGKFPFRALGKARILADADGFVKIVADSRYGEILGVHMIGPRVTDLIAEACVALQLECTTDELSHVMHAHPTLPEAVLEAAHAAVDRPLHL